MYERTRMLCADRLPVLPELGSTHNLQFYVVKTVECDVTIGDKCYEKVYTAMTWSDARDYCHQEGGYLIAPDSEDINDYVSSFMAGNWIFSRYCLQNL